PLVRRHIYTTSGKLKRIRFPAKRFYFGRATRWTDVSANRIIRAQTPDMMIDVSGHYVEQRTNRERVVTGRSAPHIGVHRQILEYQQIRPAKQFKLLQQIR